MEFYQSLFYATPVFTTLIVIEIIWGKLTGHDVYNNFPDALASLSSGIANIIMRTMGIYITIIGYSWFLGHVAMFQIPSNSVLAWVITFLVIDFSGYWTHRWAHRINFLWQTHMVHHSSEEFNLAVALRQPTTNFFIYDGFLLFPAAIVGVPVEMIAVGSFLHLYMQYWYHTQLIDKMGFLDKIIVTPTNHRVHHAMNPIYIDKNYGQILIIWDHIFGTYQAEKEDTPPVYGITVPVHTWNPFKIDLMHWWSMLKDAWFAKQWKDKLSIWIRPTGWRPDGHENRYPSGKVADPTALKKYSVKISSFQLFWSFLEVALVAYPLTMLFFWMLSYGITLEEKVLFSAFLLFNIFTYTTTMEGRSTRLLNGMRLMFACLITFLSVNNNFNFNLLNYELTPILLGFFSLSMLISFFKSFDPQPV